MTLYYEDEPAYDPPHAYALMEGQGCACASRYYGGDCAHTIDMEAEGFLLCAPELAAATPAVPA